jgi:hypothetical protein
MTAVTPTGGVGVVVTYVKATFIVAGSEVTVTGAAVVGLFIVTLVTESLKVVVATSPEE